MGLLSQTCISEFLSQNRDQSPVTFSGALIISRRISEVISSAYYCAGLKIRVHVPYRSQSCAVYQKRVNNKQRLSLWLSEHIRQSPYK